MIAAHPTSAQNCASAASVLAFDFGTRRIGVAVGEPLLCSARALTTIDAEDNSTRFNAIARLIAEWQPQQLVVGLALGMDGEEHEMTLRCRRFAHQLEGRFRLPVTLVDERLSSIEAESRLAAQGKNWKQRKQTLDAEAAATILHDYFSQQGNPGEKQ
ncbi:MAG: Holliday junction resolvase RuvX [Georgfuchsia sp.]